MNKNIQSEDTIADFREFIRLITDTNVFICCALETSDDATATFSLDYGKHHKITVDSSKVVIVD